jgi:hypothetical protein
MRSQISCLTWTGYSVSGVDTVNTWDLIQALERHLSEKKLLLLRHS